jgi:hypothetical protein
MVGVFRFESMFNRQRLVHATRLSDTVQYNTEAEASRTANVIDISIHFPERALFSCQTSWFLLRTVDCPVACHVVKPKLLPCLFHGHSLQREKIKRFKIRALHDG